MLDAVVVEIKLGVGVRCCCDFQGDFYVVGPEDGKEGIVTVGTVVVQGFVQHVLGVTLASPVLCFVSDVVDESCSEGFLRLGSIVD